MKSDDLVLLRPISSSLDKASSWNKVSVVRVININIKGAGNMLEVSAKLMTDESLGEALGGNMTV